MNESLVIREINHPSPASKFPISKQLWDHPMLELYKSDIPKDLPDIPSKLYLVPTPEYVGRDTEDLSDPYFLPQPSALSELPDIQEWVSKFALTLVEIWAGRRSSMQLARWCHRQVYLQVTNKSAAITAAPKIRKLYISQPIEGVAETTVTLKIGERVRSLILRFEGVDRRWLCTELVLL